MSEKIKGWIVYYNQYDYGVTVQLVLENGYPIYSHFCSHPGFALGDLWENKEERKKHWSDAGLELEIVDTIHASKLPDYIIENNKNDAYVDFAKKYFPQYVDKEEQE